MRPLPWFVPTLLAVALGAQASRPATGAAVETAFREHLLAQQRQRSFSGVCAAFAFADGTDGAVALGADAADVLGKQTWYPRVPNADAITLRQLLNHTSGIPEHVWKKPFQDAVTKAGDRALTPAECLAYVLDDAPVAVPGARWSYADTNYVLVGLCVEAVTGKPFFDVLRARILEPLELKDTIVNDRRDLSGLACGMASGIGFHRGRVLEEGRYFTNPAFEYCGGGLSSTTRDLARWLRALFAGDVVPAGLQADHRDGVPAARGVAERYGLGCFVTSSPHGPAFGHSGVMPGYLSYALWYPELGVAVAVQFPTDDGRAVGSLKRLVDELAGLARRKA